MEKKSKTVGIPKTLVSRQTALHTSMWQYLAAPVDPASQVSSEAYQNSEASMPRSTSPGQEEPPALPPPDWLAFLKALPTRADLEEATSTLHASLRADLQLMRSDLQGIVDRITQVTAIWRPKLPLSPHWNAKRPSCNLWQII
ncbi:Hypothetical predicted protein [Pelobates cultripes]|uniref:Uncharacterized protein n=1 Tax=Pelobates cultripes TaxID=61616 RepID=A0AAD1RL74_PELCU|nr:Hypothetical predicted protein [Pelobates cultripes]